MEYITQYFPTGEDKHSPLVHFASVLGIIIETSKFRESYNYTTYVAALLWVSRLFFLEYALPKRKYATLDWLTRTEYMDPGQRLEHLRRQYMIEGIYYPIANLLSTLLHGRRNTKSVSRPGQIIWDSDEQGLQIKQIQLRLDDYRDFIRQTINILVDTIHQDLFFNIMPPIIDLTKIKDHISESKPMYSLFKQPENELNNGCIFMLKNWMEDIPEELRLIDDDGVWNTRRIAEYLRSKKRFLRLLMLSII